MDKNPKKKEPGRPGSPRTASRPKAKSWEMLEKLLNEFTRAVLTAFPEAAQELLALRAADREARRAVLCDAQAILEGERFARHDEKRDMEKEDAGRELYQLAEALIHGAPPPALRTISARKFLAHLNDAREKAEALAAAAQRVLGGDLSGAKAEAAETVKWYLAGNCWRDWQAYWIRRIQEKYKNPQAPQEGEKRKWEISLRLSALYKEISALRAQAEAADNPAESARLNAVCEKKVAETRELIEQERELELIEQKRKQGNGESQNTRKRPPYKRARLTQKYAAEIIATTFKGRGLDKSCSARTISRWETGSLQKPYWYPGLNVPPEYLAEKAGEGAEDELAKRALKEAVPFDEKRDSRQHR